jgi:hypothetical protein
MNEANGNKAMIAAGAVSIVAAIPALAALWLGALALALSNPVVAVNAGWHHCGGTAAIVKDSITPGVTVEAAGTKAVSTGAESALMGGFTAPGHLRNA